jgi:hypothetical protein
MRLIILAVVVVGLIWIFPSPGVPPCGLHPGLASGRP